MTQHPEKNMVFLSPGFPGPEGDEDCLPAQQSLVRVLQRDFRMNVSVIAFQYPFREGTYTWNGCPVRALGGRNRGGWYRLRTWVRAWRALRQAAKTQPVSAVVSFWAGDCALVGHWFCRRYRISHAIWILGQDAKRPNALLRWFRPAPGELVAMSDFLVRSFMTNHGIRPLHTVPNAIDPALFPTVIGPGRSIDIIGAGSLIPLKRWDMFIRVVAALVPHFPNLRAVICGDGPELAGLEKDCRELGIASHIQFAGKTSHSQVLALMQQSRILLHPSSYEGFSGACLEALYAGAHVVSSCHPMDAWIRHWHIADTEEEMIAACLALLRLPAIDHSRVLPYAMTDSAGAFLRILGMETTA